MWACYVVGGSPRRRSFPALRCAVRRPRVAARRTVKPVASSGKTDITKVGLNSIDNEVIKNNLMGKSRFMNKKDWKDASGRKGTVRSFAAHCACL